MSVDVGLDKIIEIANEWIKHIVFSKKEKEAKIEANILLSAGLLVVNIRSLNQSFTDILSQFFLLDPTWSKEMK